MNSILPATSRAVSRRYLSLSFKPHHRQIQKYATAAAVAAAAATASNTFKQWRIEAQRPFLEGKEKGNMATPYKIHLTPEMTGVYHVQPQTKETAEKTSAFLQEDLEHIFFNHDGFHNHIVHHLLTMYGLGAPADLIEKQYHANASYQRAIAPVKESLVEDLSHPDVFLKNVGKEKQYHNYLLFFQKEMERKGMEDVLQEYLFSGTEVAETMLVLMFAGFLHPIIHLGFGLEFQQPAIVCEALAEAAVHTAWMKPYLLGAEEKAKTLKSKSAPPSKTLPALLDEIRADPTLSKAAHYKDGNKIRDGLMVRAPDEAIHYASQWYVTADTLEPKSAEMMNTCALFSAAAQHPPKQVKFDFFLMHSLNCSVFWSTFNKLPWLSIDNKIRLLEWKGRTDLALYASRACPEILMDEIVQYVPKHVEAGGGEWPGIFARLFEHEDDGHAVTLGRAIANAEQVSAKWEGEEWCKIRGDMWLKIGNMAVDSVEDEGEPFVRSTGFEEAWKDFKDRPRSVL